MTPDNTTDPGAPADPWDLPPWPDNAEFENPEQADIEQRDSRLHAHTPEEVLGLWRGLCDTSYVPTPLRALNMATGGGFPIGSVTVVSAYTGCYKSEFVRHCVKHAASKGNIAIHVDVELGYKDIYDRHLSDVSGVPHSRVRNKHRRTAADVKKIEQAMLEISRQGWRLNCPGSGLPIETIEQVLAEALMPGEPALVAFDSIQRLASGLPEENPRLATQGFCRWLEYFAQKYNVAVLAITEQSRAQGGGKPRASSALTSGAESRSIEYVAGLFLHLDWGDGDEDMDDVTDSESPGETRVGIRIEKSRMGGKGRLRQELVFTRPCWRMDIARAGPSGHAKKVLDLLSDGDAHSVRNIRKEVGGRVDTIKRSLRQLEADGAVIMTDQQNWVLTDAGW